MGFVLLRRDDGEVTLITPSVFDTRREALDEVTQASADGHLAADEVFLVDLDASTPVLIVTPPSAPEEEAPIEAADSVATEPAAVAPPVELAVSAAAPSTIEVEDAIAEAIIADAEEQGVEDVPAEAPSAVEDVLEPLDEPGVPSATDVAADEEPTARIWPWEPAPVPIEPLSPPVEAAADLKEEPEQETSEEPIADEDTPVDESADEVSGLLADLEEIGAEAPAPAQMGVEEPADSPAEPEPSKAYEAGASDITTLTCDDCIYLNTCPKQGESDPTSCGSFQWKSV